jgi:hypothetical protein
VTLLSYQYTNTAAVRHEHQNCIRSRHRPGDVMQGQITQSTYKSAGDIAAIKQEALFQPYAW